MILNHHPSVDPAKYEGTKVWKELYEKFGPQNGLQFLGYWKSQSEPDLPDPLDYVDNDWDSDDRALVVAHLVAGEVWESWRGNSVCRFLCGQDTGSRCFTDGAYVWPEGFAHYVAEHGVRPPQEFIDHIVIG